MRIREDDAFHKNGHMRQYQGVMQCHPCANMMVQNNGSVRMDGIAAEAKGLGKRGVARVEGANVPKERSHITLMTAIVEGL